ncbi:MULTISPECIES: hypothetical protein [unclassified Bartonella]
MEGYTYDIMLNVYSRWALFALENGAGFFAIEDEIGFLLVL